jgi:hypothetical protein
MNAKTLALKAQRLAETEGGFTLDALSAETPKKGFAVGGVERSARIPLNANVSHGIEDYILLNKRALLDGYGYLGGRVDGGELVLDVCSVEEDRETAERRAAAYGEEAYFDIESQDAIYV